MLSVLGAVGVSETTITTTVGALKAEYAGCGSHELEVELTYSDGSGPQWLAKQLRAEADRIAPIDPIEAIGPSFAEVKSDRAELIEAGRAVVGYRNGHTEYLLAAAVDHLYNVMKRLGAYE